MKVNALLRQLAQVRDRVLVAMTRLQAGDEAGAAEEIASASEGLQTASDELREDIEQDDEAT